MEDVRGGFRPNDRCRIHGLVHAREYNGHEGTVIGWADELGRWRVRIDVVEGPAVEKQMRCVNMEQVPPAGGVDAVSDDVPIADVHGGDELFGDLIGGGVSDGIGVGGAGSGEESLRALFGEVGLAKAQAKPKRTYGREYGLYMAACKRARQGERTAEQLRSESAPTFAAWDAKRLHAGTQLAEHNASHPTQYTVSGVLLSAWNQLGAMRTMRTGLDHLHRELEVLTVVSSAAQRAQQTWLTDALKAIMADPDPVFVFTRWYDATPMRVRFGQMQAELSPHARYPYWSKDLGRWVSLTLEQYRAMPDVRREIVMRYGVVEVLAQGLTLHQADQHGIVKASRVLCPPSILQRSNTSCIFSATEGAAPALAIPQLMELRHSTRFMLLNEVPDACAPNLRKKQATAKACAKAKNILHAGHNCCAHQAPF